MHNIIIQRYNSLVTMGSTISKHLFHLPETINVDLDDNGEPCTDHLFVNAEGTATFNHKGWEPITLNEERKHPNYVCWLRNKERKPWALCIPYKYGNDHITNYYIVAEKDSVYRKVKEEVNEQMGKIEETVPVKMPMKDGFKANAAFFKLGFLDKRSVARGRQLQELLPLLWMKAGAKGECPSEVTGDYVIWPNNHMALLKDEAHFRNFHKEITKHPKVETVYIITDSQSAYLNMIAVLKGKKTYQLYRDYLENFRINYAAK